MARRPSDNAKRHAERSMHRGLPARAESRFRVLYHAGLGEYVFVDTWTEPTPRDVFFATRREATGA
ncbi:MAG TPA: hypothetical protein VHK06_07495 [Candidatus Limnocylindria bacterium]|nr:hypothetical protein [Candidatus Limnocylindria bacterium]